MNDFQIDSQPMCFKHNQPAVLFSQKINNLLCKICLESQQFTLLEDYLNQQKKVFFNLQSKSNLCLNLLKELLENLDAYKQNLIKTIDNLTYTLNQQQKIIQEKQSNFKQLFQKYLASTVEMINNEEKSIMNILDKLNDQFNIELIKLANASKVDNLFQILNNHSSKINQIYEEDEDMQKQSKVSVFGGFSTQSSIMIDKKFDYQLIQKSSYKQNDDTYAIAFNKDATIMISGCDQLIKVFEFKDDKIREVQQLNGHSNDVYCLQFMKKSNQFISASYDSTMIVWEYNQNNLWQSNQVLKGHSSSIYCIAMNQNEDILISGSYDNTIKFWSKSNNTWNSIQSIDCQSDVKSISLSELEDKLIVSVYNNQILMLQMQGKEWMIKQKISVQQLGYRLCFINQDQFVFQPRDAQHLLIFDYDSKDQTFKQGQELQYANKVNDGYTFFPIRYISQIGLILVKHGDNVHLIKRSQKGQLIIEQSINFGTNNLHGGIADDGRYIALWDGKTKVIQIRKFDY